MVQTTRSKVQGDYSENIPRSQRHTSKEERRDFGGCAAMMVYVIHFFVFLFFFKISDSVDEMICFHMLGFQLGLLHGVSHRLK